MPLGGRPTASSGAPGAGTYRSMGRAMPLRFGITFAAMVYTLAAHYLKLA